MIDRHVYRPAHIHLLVQAKGYGRLVTQIFDQESEYMDNDTVFAVKSGLSVRFVPREGDPQAKLELQYDISLAESS
ncbi:hypothetical protein CDD83_4216 [Cordyceps sp. RAO-2017]|nr:hypothetical protein CDD83_4216 [Cordyceps sp. RAO-2017]